jgi:hypothetical protein
VRSILTLQYGNIRFNTEAGDTARCGSAVYIQELTILRGKRVGGK